MNTLIERWEDKATAKVGVEDEERYGVKLCLQELSDACTPRPPKPEWFGTGPGQWDSWWVEFVPSYRHRPMVMHACFQIEGVLHSNLFGCDLREIKHCVPVAREGFPAPVGWHVVGG